MFIFKIGGLASISLGAVYIIGFILFFAVLSPGASLTPIEHLAFVIDNQNSFVLGYLIIGVFFSLALFVLVQATHHKFHACSPALSKFTSNIGYFWASIVMISALIFIVSLSKIPEYYASNAEHALLVNQAINIVVNALGGGVELIGAIWVLLLSYLGLKYKAYVPWLHYLGYFVGLAGILTLLSSFTFATGYAVFEASTAIFGLGQIPWFIALGVFMLKENAD